MAKNLYVGVNGTAKEATKIYVGVNNVAKEVTKGYIKVGNENKLFWDGSKNNEGFKSSDIYTPDCYYETIDVIPAVETYEQGHTYPVVLYNINNFLSDCIDIQLKRENGYTDEYLLSLFTNYQTYNDLKQYIINIVTSLTNENYNLINFGITLEGINSTPSFRISAQLYQINVSEFTVTRVDTSGNGNRHTGYKFSHPNDVGKVGNGNSSDPVIGDFIYFYIANIYNDGTITTTVNQAGVSGSYLRSPQTVDLLYPGTNFGWSSTIRKYYNKRIYYDFINNVESFVNGTNLYIHDKINEIEYISFPNYASNNNFYTLDPNLGLICNCAETSYDYIPGGPEIYINYGKSINIEIGDYTINNSNNTDGLRGIIFQKKVYNASNNYLTFQLRCNSYYEGYKWYIFMSDGNSYIISEDKDIFKNCLVTVKFDDINGKIIIYKDKIELYSLNTAYNRISHTIDPFTDVMGWFYSYNLKKIYAE